MNLRNWTRHHTYGLLIGIFSPLIFAPLVIFLLALSRGFSFGEIWNMFLMSKQASSKIISLAIISNLIWFYIFINRNNYGLAMGIILGTICYLPYIVYVNLIM
ncbi:MAG: hypothetical protein LW688_07915 [Cryomorphaceae bacterium]|jgi:hypothetical protein|nr:hypothetical protein [Cryomorphaceae bacterium]